MGLRKKKLGPPSLFFEKPPQKKYHARPRWGLANARPSVRNHPESSWVLGGWVHPAQNFAGCWVAGCTQLRILLGAGWLGGFFEHWLDPSLEFLDITYFFWPFLNV